MADEGWPEGKPLPGDDAWEGSKPIPRAKRALARLENVLDSMKYAAPEMRDHWHREAESALGLIAKALDDQAAE